MDLCGTVYSTVQISRNTPNPRARLSVLTKPRLFIVSITGAIGINFITAAIVKKKITNPLDICPIHCQTAEFSAEFWVIFFILSQVNNVG
jgi:hypothetical protein